MKPGEREARGFQLPDLLAGDLLFSPKQEQPVAVEGPAPLLPSPPS